MILPTEDQMKQLAPGCKWQEPDYKDELWKYDPPIKVSWDTLHLEKKRLQHKMLVQGVSVSDVQEYRNVFNAHNQIEQLVNILYESGIIIHVPKNCSVTISLNDICYLSSVQKIIIIVESNAQVTVIDNRVITAFSLLCESIEIKVGQAAQVTYVDQLTVVPSNILLRSLHINADANSLITIHSMQPSSLYSKLFVRAELNGSHAQVTMKFAVQSSGAQYHSIITEQIHAAPYTQSRCIVKAAQCDAQSMYHGRILIPKEGHQSQAFQHHKALLLNQVARAYARPTIEVLTNDVQCGHGSAIGMLDANQVWYLQSRGLTYQTAEKMLVNAFLQEVYPPVVAI